jgi:hypothetical protein
MTIVANPIVSCPACGCTCKPMMADPDADAPSKFGGWYCEPCDIYAETDVEIEE